MKLFDMQSNKERLQMKFFRPLFICLSPQGLICCPYNKFLKDRQIVKLQLNKYPKLKIGNSHSRLWKKVYVLLSLGGNYFVIQHWTVQ